MRLKKLCTVKDEEAIKRMIESRRQQVQKSSYISNKIVNQPIKTAQSNSGSGMVIGMFPDLKPFVQSIEDQIEEDEQGYCVPKTGADPAYDLVVLRIKDIYKQMNEEAKFWSNKLKDNDIKLVKSKISWEIQIPEHLVQDMKKPKELYLTSKVKNYQRFQSDIMVKLCEKLKKAEIHLQKALTPFCERFFYQFYQKRGLLYQAVNCIGELDCFCSLAKCANGLNIKCKPQFIPQDPLKDPHKFELCEMHHPQMIKDKKTKVVPNDTIFDNGVIAMLVTGPNMGGKSTLLRQTCLAVILAQIGAFIPARSFTTQIKDRIFCRIGASDRLQEGKSTFLVEMEETGDIVKEATRQSIVLLDELGRGTSTFDGVSIAYGVLRYIVEEIKCLTMFSTHYHMLVDEFKLYNNVENYCMDFEFEEKKNSQSTLSNDRKINFKYKFIKGFSEKSFGLNVARMAAIPHSIIQKAKRKEDELNSENQNLGNLLKLTQVFNSIVKPFINVQLKEAEFSQAGSSKKK